MYGVAETLADRIPSAEEYIARVPAIAIVPWFFAGSLFPITALPGVLTWFARVLPLTHALALMRYGLLDDSSGLHDIWHEQRDPMAALSLGVVALFAAVLSSSRCASSPARRCASARAATARSLPTRATSRPRPGR